MKILEMQRKESPSFDFVSTPEFKRDTSLHARIMVVGRDDQLQSDSHLIMKSTNNYRQKRLNVYLRQRMLSQAGIEQWKLRWHLHIRYCMLSPQESQTFRGVAIKVE